MHAAICMVCIRIILCIIICMSMHIQSILATAVCMHTTVVWMALCSLAMHACMHELYSMCAHARCKELAICMHPCMVCDVHICTNCTVHCMHTHVRCKELGMCGFIHVREFTINFTNNIIVD